MASVAGCTYAYRRNEIYSNLLLGNEASIAMEQRRIKIKQETRYPWDGSVKITVFPQIESDKFSILIRSPGWAQNQSVPSDLYRFLDATNEKVTPKAIEKRPRLAAERVRPSSSEAGAWVRRSSSSYRYRSDESWPMTTSLPIAGGWHFSAGRW